MKTVYLTECCGEVRGAFLEGNTPWGFFLHRHQTPAYRDGIFFGRVIGHPIGLNWAIVDLGSGLSGYLNLPAKQRPPIGSRLLVQSLDPQLPAQQKNTHETADLHRLLKLTTHITLASAYLVFMPDKKDVTGSRDGPKNGPKNGSKERWRDDQDDKQDEAMLLVEALRSKQFRGVVRQGAFEVAQSVVLANWEALQQRWQQLQEDYRAAQQSGLLFQPSPVYRWLRSLGGAGGVDRLVVDAHYAASTEEGVKGKNWRQGLIEEVGALNITESPHGQSAFPEDVEAAWEDLYESVIPLESGGSLEIHPTPAATLFDVNAGTTRGSNPENTHLRVNLEAAKEVVRQCCLRQLSGLILVDFITMKNPGGRKQLEQALRTAAKQDPSGMHVHGISPLGVGEIIREGRSHAIPDQLLQPADRSFSPLTVAYKVLRACRREAIGRPLTVAVSSSVADCLQTTLRDEWAGMEAALGTVITIQKRSQDDAQSINVFDVYRV